MWRCWPVVHRALSRQARLYTDQVPRISTARLRLAPVLDHRNAGLVAGWEF